MNRYYRTYYRKQIKSYMADTVLHRPASGGLSFNSTITELSIVSLNMHGFQQSCDFLSESCESQQFDIIHLQEHWLNDAQLHKLAALSPNYIMYGESAMKEATKKDILVGRPFGGCATLIKCELAAMTVCRLITDRIVALDIAGSLFVNLYLPYEDSEAGKELTIDILASVANVISDKYYDHIFLGGDMNTDLHRNRKHSYIVRDFLTAHDMNFGRLDAQYTFSNEKSGAYSTIDFWCMSSDIMQYVSIYKTIDSAICFSDHLPVKLVLALPTDDPLALNLRQRRAVLNSNAKPFGQDKGTHRGPMADQKDEATFRLRFDHCNHAKYYECTRVLLEPILERINIEYSRCGGYASENNFNINQDTIEGWYTDIVEAVTQAASTTVPKVKSGTLKHFWDEELNELKRTSINSHDLWVEAGKPRSGDIYANRTRDKYKYKAAINARKLTEKCTVSANLHDTLLNKKTKEFWKTWKNKVCNQRVKRNPSVDGSNDEAVIIENFRSYFEKVCTNNSSDYNNKVKNEFDRVILNGFKNTQNVDKQLFCAELVALSVAKLHPGKATCFDGLQSEHISYCHPIIYTVLARLFYMIMISGYVPKDFKCGMLIPIPKETGTKKALKVDQFRGITISPVISKVFENCLLTVYKDYLTTSDRQFAYKNNSSCSHAIYSVRCVIEHFASNNTTVNICCLDISKAFDKVNHYALFLKLIDRNAPGCFIKMLQNWYLNSTCRVKWGNLLSAPFVLQGGVRQGGVLSPILFLVYVDNILVKLGPYGCVVQGLSMSAFMYADDLILLSPSIVELQSMVDLCGKEFAAIDLKINGTKSTCMRIGPRWHRNCVSIHTENGPIAWVKETTYLGVKILAGPKFKISLDDCKTNFYSSYNSIYSQLGKFNSDLVTLELISTIALPCLLYAIEAIPFTKSFLRTLDHPWTRVFNKIFNTFDADVILSSQFYSGHLPLEHVAKSRKVRFLNNMLVSSCLYIQTVASLFANDELSIIAKFYNVDVSHLVRNCQEITYKYVELMIGS